MILHLPNRSTCDEHSTKLPLIDGVALVGETRIAGDDKQRRVARQCRDDVFHDTVSKVILLGVAAQILERQNRNRGLIGERQWLACDSWTIESQ